METAISVPYTVDMLDLTVALEDLMQRYLDGDEAAFAELYRRLQPKLAARLRRFVQGPVVEDLVQATFLRAHKARHRFDFEIGSNPRDAVVHWYFAIGKNLALEHLRRASRRSLREAKLEARGELEGMGAAATQTSPEQLLLHHDRNTLAQQRLRGAIQRLPQAQREVIELHKLQGLSIAEVSRRVGVKAGTLRVRTHRAVRSLTRLMTHRPPLAPAC